MEATVKRSMNLKIPYDLSNFKDVIIQGYFYVDKTAYIARLEDAGKYQILLLSSPWYYVTP